jgi:hypothetical protein
MGCSIAQPPRGLVANARRPERLDPRSHACQERNQKNGWDDGSLEAFRIERRYSSHSVEPWSVSAHGAPWRSSRSRSRTTSAAAAGWVARHAEGARTAVPDAGVRLLEDPVGGFAGVPCRAGLDDQCQRRWQVVILLSVEHSERPKQWHDAAGSVGLSGCAELVQLKEQHERAVFALANSGTQRAGLLEREPAV